MYHSYGERNSKGVSIVIKKQLQFEILDINSDTNGR